MKTLRSLLFSILFSLVSISQAHAKIHIVTTTVDLQSITQEISNPRAFVESLTKGTQDPHSLEAKPSFMVKVSSADLLIANGLDLEVGWLPSIIRGARNPKIANGQIGYLEIGSLVDPIEVIGGASRAEGDVHPAGNPHVTLDPVRAIKIAKIICDRLILMDSSNKLVFEKNLKQFEERIQTKLVKWQERIKQSGVKSIVTYHKTLSYFFSRFGISNPIILEPKPGIPPTSRHIVDVINLIKDQKVPIILVENYFDPSVTRKIQAEIPELRIATVPVSTLGDPKIKTIDDLYEEIVNIIGGKQ